MSYKIAIASGKGGTGKTTVSINLFSYLSKRLANKVQLVDCDVEEPNDMLFFPNAKKIKEEEITKLVPIIDNEKCTYCRKCVEYCEFNSIVVIPTFSFAEVNASLCHSCGACLVACEFGAITEKPHPIGIVKCFQTEYGEIIEGRLNIGSAMQTPLIKETKKFVSKDSEIVIYDAPPGTSCPVVETISDANYIILVTEPTLFGLHDLKLMIELLKEVEIPYGVVINKAGLGDRKVYQFLEEEKIELITEIPFSKDFAASYAQGIMDKDVPEEITQAYSDIFIHIAQKMK